MDLAPRRGSGTRACCWRSRHRGLPGPGVWVGRWTATPFAGPRCSSSKHAAVPRRAAPPPFTAALPIMYLLLPCATGSESCADCTRDGESATAGWCCNEVKCTAGSGSTANSPQRPLCDIHASLHRARGHAVTTLPSQGTVSGLGGTGTPVGVLRGVTHCCKPEHVGEWHFTIPGAFCCGRMGGPVPCQVIESCNSLPLTHMIALHLLLGLGEAPSLT